MSTILLILKAVSFSSQTARRSGFYGNLYRLS